MNNQEKIKIFDYAWHIPHQYDMMYALRDDCEFYYGINVKRQWNASTRAMPSNFKMVTHYTKGMYDVAILHIDQQVIGLDSQKTLVYDQFNDFIDDVPKIVINHGTPVFPEWFQEYMPDMSEEEMQPEIVRRIKLAVGDNTMVVNSYTSATDSEWGFGIPIVHGINPNDWWDLPKEPRVFTALSSMGFGTYYNRGCMKAVSAELYEKYGHILAYANVNIDTGKSPEAYKEYLGRSLLYLDTSYRTPMNRARTEAFLSGCCVLQVEGAHDLDRFAKDGENIILLPNNPHEIAAIIDDLLTNRYEEAIAIGQRGKEMAITHFSPRRYRRDWVSLLNKVVNKETLSV